MQATADKILKESLIGSMYTGFSVQDWWSFQLGDGLWLVAQDVVSPEEAGLNSILSVAEPPVLDAIDNVVAKGIVILRNMRRTITEVMLSDDGALRLIFEGNRELQLSVTTDVVDWQWCLNRTGLAPYKDFIVGCFFKGEIEVARES